VKAEVLAVGTEILLGEIVDSNSAFIAARLPALGIRLYRMTQLGDNRDRLVAHLRAALADNDLVVTTGGLGPTEDDVTREAVAEAFGEVPFVDPELEAALRAWFGRRNMPMPERNVKQAWRIASAQTVPNPRGTAPGWWVEKDGRIVVCLPGPPAEMGPMWEHEVAPRLAALATEVIITRTLKTVGIGEGRVDEMLGELLKNVNPTIGVYARGDGIHIRLGARAATAGQAQDLIVPVETQIRQLMGNALWGTDAETLQDAVMTCLQGRTLAVVEDSTSGGHLAALLSGTGHAAWRGGEVWSDGPVSIEAARARSAAARVRWGAHVGIGIAASRDGVFHVAIGDESGTECHTWTFPQGMAALRQRVSTTALSLLRRRYS
jgi:nicotinamide-nucleotide amidase